MFCSRAVPLVSSSRRSFLPRPQIRYRRPSPLSFSLSLSPLTLFLSLAIPHERIILHVMHIIITDVRRIVVDHNRVDCNRARG